LSFHAQTSCNIYGLPVSRLSIYLHATVAAGNWAAATATPATLATLAFATALETRKPLAAGRQRQINSQGYMPRPRPHTHTHTIARTPSHLLFKKCSIQLRAPPSATSAAVAAAVGPLLHGNCTLPFRCFSCISIVSRAAGNSLKILPRQGQCQALRNFPTAQWSENDVGEI